MSEKAVTAFTVIRNRVFSPTTHCLVLQAPGTLLPVSAGQFVNVEIPGNMEVFLRRPFSIFEVNYRENTLSLLVKIVGKGSQALSLARTGDSLSLIYPLGRGFTLPADHERVLAIGGGSGVAPLVLLATEAALPPGHMTLLLGAKTKADHIPGDLRPHNANFCVTTEDGSLGVRGLVTDHPLFSDFSLYDKIYACGPLPMMKSVAVKASAEKRFCEVSLENLMACGFGVCLCCIEPTVKGNLCVCTEGPVFNITDLLW